MPSPASPPTPRDVLDGASKGDENCEMAAEMFSYRAGQLFAEMAASMGAASTPWPSPPASARTRRDARRVADKLAWLGVELDPELNAVRSDDPRVISTPNSKITCLVVPTNEELMIALDVEALLG